VRWPWLAGLTVAALAAAAPVAGQSQPPPCSSAVGRPSIAIEEHGSSVLYATHNLALKVSGNFDVQVRSVSAPAAHVDLEPEENPEGGPVLVTDKAGAFPVTAVFKAFEHDGSECTTSASTTAQLAAPARSTAGKLKRPHYLVKKRRLYPANPTFRFKVAPDKAAPDRSPFTVRARVSRRLKLPGKGAKAKTKTYPQREFEFKEPKHLQNGCQYELVCPRRTARGFAKGVEVGVRPIGGGRLATKGLRLVVTSPSGYPADRALKFFQSPWGLDLQVLQSGRQIARLKVVARCSGGGQSSRCRFKKVLLAR
jgi:hypothetical protein